MFRKSFYKATDVFKHRLLYLPVPYIEGLVAYKLHLNIPVLYTFNFFFTYSPLVWRLKVWVLCVFHKIMSRREYYKLLFSSGFIYLHSSVSWKKYPLCPPLLWAIIMVIPHSPSSFFYYILLFSTQVWTTVWQATGYGNFHVTPLPAIPTQDRGVPARPGPLPSHAGTKVIWQKQQQETTRTQRGMPIITSLKDHHICG